jgi:hypothetical protein
MPTKGNWDSSRRVIVRDRVASRIERGSEAVLSVPAQKIRRLSSE